MLDTSTIVDTYYVTKKPIFTTYYPICIYRGIAFFPLVSQVKILHMFWSIILTTKRIRSVIKTSSRDTARPIKVTLKESFISVYILEHRVQILCYSTIPKLNQGHKCPLSSTLCFHFSFTSGCSNHLSNKVNHYIFGG